MQIRLAVDVASSYGRGVVLGVMRYARERGRWMLNLEDVSEPHKRFEGDVDGIIVQAATDQMIQEAVRRGVPAVNISAARRETGIPTVTLDNVAAGRVAATHLVERGFKQLAFIGLAGSWFSETRARGVEEVAANRGLAFTQHGNERVSDKSAGTRLLLEWVKSIPLPCGVVAANDVRARHFARSAQGLGLRVPEELAVVGIDNDEIECEIAGVPLSSVVVPTDKIGYEAAVMLEALMSGEAVPPIRLIPPGEVTIRQSSDIVAIDDPEVGASLRFIRDHATRGIVVDDVVDAASMARRTFEQRFRVATGRSVHEEIRRVQIERAKQLLKESDLPIASIATACGFSAAYYLSVTFRKQTGQTPREYRKQFELR